MSLSEKGCDSDGAPREVGSEHPFSGASSECVRGPSAVTYWTRFLGEVGLSMYEVFWHNFAEIVFGMIGTDWVLENIDQLRGVFMDDNTCYADFTDYGCHVVFQVS